jgi:hypothetical protein
MRRPQLRHQLRSMTVRVALNAVEGLGSRTTSGNKERNFPWECALYLCALSTDIEISDLLLENKYNQIHKNRDLSISSNFNIIYFIYYYLSSIVVAVVLLVVVSRPSHVVA